MSLHDALGGMRDVPQWFVWRLTWDAAKGKYQKMPVSAQGHTREGESYGSDPKHWLTYGAACEALSRLGGTHALGFWMTADCGYWFFDLDGCVVDGALLPLAGQLAAAFPGALIEYSSSGRGLHVIGAGTAPEHRSKPPREVALQCKPMDLEFYTQDRGIAFGLSGQANGSADTRHDAMVQALCAHYFPPRAVGELVDGPRAQWRGPADDDVLIERMLKARPSAGVVFGNKAGLPALWSGEAEKTSEHDMALAAHLAFWTGCDEERIARLMMRSGLVREKWRERRPHGTYLSHTIAQACAGTTAVYQEPERSTAMQIAMYGANQLPAAQGADSKLISDETNARFEELLDLCAACGRAIDMHNDIIPAIRESALPLALRAPLVESIRAKLKLLGAPLSVGEIRKLVSPPVVHGASEAPLWVHKQCYVKATDKFFDMDTGEELTMQGFQAEYTRLMPPGENGRRANPVEWALNVWDMRTVHRTGYRPDQGSYFEWEGLEYANTYNANSLPAVATEWTPAGLAGIEALQRHLWDMAGRRKAVYEQLLWWMAHNVQKPGVKIRWSPLLKGVQGDGKTLITTMLRAAMGSRNVSVTGNATLTNSGGFNDWAVKAAVNIIEEIMLKGMMRHQLYNAMKEFVSNDVVNINPKGKVTRDQWNVTNHWANTNHNDGIPLDKDDRRWLIVFTPWYDLADMQRYCGLTAEAWKARTDAMDRAWKTCAGELRAWFLSIEIGAEFNKDSSAMLTPERMQMMATGRDDVEQAALQIISDGAPGICSTVFSSSRLTNLLRLKAAQENFDVPRTSNLSHMFTRIGFSKLPKDFRWQGQTHTIWINNGSSDDFEIIRANLDATIGS